MLFTSRAKEILIKNKDLLEDLDKFYQSIPVSVSSEITSLFINSGINVLENVSRIYPAMFAYTENFVNLKLPKNIKIIKQRAFLESKIKTVTIDKGCEHIQAFAFARCHGLEKISIPTSVIKLDNSIFFECENLYQIEYQGTKQQWMDIDKSPRWNQGMPYSKIVCLDGTIEYLELQK